MRAGILAGVLPVILAACTSGRGDHAEVLDAEATFVAPDAAVRDATAPVDSPDSSGSDAYGTYDGYPSLYPNGDLDAALANSCGVVPDRLSCTRACTSQNAGDLCLLPHGCQITESDLMCVCDRGQWQCPSCWFVGRLEPYFTSCSCEQPADRSACTDTTTPYGGLLRCDYPDGGTTTACSCTPFKYSPDGAPFVQPDEAGPPPDGSFVTRWQWSCEPSFHVECPLSPYDLTDTCIHDQFNDRCYYYAGTNSLGGLAADIVCECTKSNQWTCLYVPGSNEYPSPDASCIGRPRGIALEPGTPWVPAGYTTCTCEGTSDPVYVCTAAADARAE